MNNRPPPTPEQLSKIRSAESSSIPQPKTTSAEREARALSKLARIRQGKAILRDGIWPNSDAPFKYRVLSHHEVQECRAAAETRLREVGIDLGHMHNLEAFEDEIILQILHLACRDPEDTDRTFAESADDMRENSSLDEQRLAFSWFCDLQAEVNPWPDSATPEELEAFVLAVKKKDRATLVGFGSPKLSACLLSTGVQLSISPTAS